MRAISSLALLCLSAISVASAQRLAPIIGNVQATQITASSATITWITNDPASSQVEYGLTAAYTWQTRNDTQRVISHSVTLSGLSAGQLYHFRAVSNGSGYGKTYSVDYTFTTAPYTPVVDTTGPAIAAVSAGSITASGAVISWTTNEPATTQVQYGPTSAYGLVTPQNTSLVTAHSATLAGLTAATTYHYRVLSTDQAGNTSYSGDYTLTTTTAPATADTTAPVISAISAGSVTATGAVVTWSTNEGATSQVQYGLTTSYGSSTPQDSTLVTAHTAGLSGLTAGSVYHYRVLSTDQAGNVATSADATFTTAAAADTTAPVISNVSSGTPTTSSATITWTTNEGATTQVEYGTSTAYGSNSALDSSKVTAHSVALASLQAGTVYHFRVLSTDAAGNTASSADASFTTASTTSNTNPGGVKTYTSPYCENGQAGPTSAYSWACGAWPTTQPPALPAVGQSVADPDTHNRVLRVTGQGSYSQTGSASFFTDYAGWNNDWAADDSALIVRSWGGDGGKFWVGFDPSTMTLTGKSGRIPDNFSGDLFAFDDTNPDLIVGVWGNIVRTWSRSTGATADLFTLTAVTAPFTMSAKGNRICVANGPQDSGNVIECYDRSSKTKKVIDVRAQTINGQPYVISYRGGTTAHPGAGIHAINVGADGAWMSVDVHGTPQCTATGLGNYSIQSQAFDLVNNRVYSWSLACGQTHWAMGYGGVMVHGAAAAWTSGGFAQAGSCANDDDRGLVMRTASDVDGSLKSLYCPPLPATYGLGTHFSWQNNANDANSNQYPIAGVSWRQGLSNRFLFNDVFAVDVTQAQNTARVWRFAQTWNDTTSANCDFLGWTSPVVSRSGRFIAYPSNWMGQTGTGSCTNSKRVDVFIFEMK